MLEEGTKAPEFSLPDQDGNEVNLIDLRGQTIVLYFYHEPTRRSTAPRAGEHHSSASDLARKLTGCLATLANQFEIS
jgi:peroxiredoxin